MTRQDFMNEFYSRLSHEFEGYRLLNKSGNLQEVQVYRQYLPQPQGITFADKANHGLKSYSESDYDSNFPCIIIKLEDMTDREENNITQSVINVKILTGIYDDSTDSQGYQDILNIQDKLRQYLQEHRLICRKYLLTMPMTSRLLEVETWPVWFGEMELVYQMGRGMMPSRWVNRPAGM